MESLATIADIITIINTLTPFFQKVQKTFKWDTHKRDGIVKRSQLLSKKRLPREVFAAEILKEPVRIEQSQNSNHPQVIIDRRNVERVVITNAGKTVLCKNFVAPEFYRLVELDKSIHAFMRRLLCEGTEKPLILPPMPFRWASGGILSVVTIGAKRYIPMFFRDIPPAGWNISLGSSERLFNTKGELISNMDHEFNTPSQFILREFIEETLILDRHPGRENPKSFFFRMPYNLRNDQAFIVKHLKNQHRDLRREYDRVIINDDEDLILRPNFLPLPMDLKIKNDQGDFELSNVLVSINCLELGIEVVKVIEYIIPKNIQPYFLDGEILSNNPTIPELARMPVALFSIKLLSDLFSGNVELNYHGEAQASLEVSRTITTNDIILFKWDIERRIAIIEDITQGIGSEHTRYQSWKKNFGKDFSTERISRLFTPATVKILNLLFSSNILSSGLG